MLMNAVFEGGGVKGIAFAGAISLVEQRGHKFYNVAGTSSGAIVASLLAAGYTGEELRDIIMKTPFSSFLDKSGLLKVKYVGSLVRLFVKKGLYPGERLEKWVSDLLLQKGIRTFNDLRPNQLRIIASDISQGKLLVLPDDIAHYGFDPTKLSVAKAVRMSTSIPYFFEPVIIKRTEIRKEINPLTSPSIYIMDGGLLSNFPLWLFDKDMEKENELSLKIPTYGFRLVGMAEKAPAQINGPISMLEALFNTMLDAHDERHLTEMKSAKTIKIPTLGVKVTEFDITRETSMKLFESGVQAATKFFDLVHYD